MPLARERFDLVLRRRSYFEPPLQRFFSFLRGEPFRRKAELLGHYGIGETGAVVLNA